MQMRARRQELHALALDVLEKIYDGDLESRYAELAYHAENGVLREKAQKYNTLAGRVSARVYQNSQAVDYFMRALAYTPFEDLTAQFDIVMERIEIFSRLGKRDLQLQDLKSLEQWAGQLQDTDRLMQARMLRSAYHFLIGNYHESIKFAEQVEDTSEPLSNSDLAHYTLIIWATALLHLGRMDEAMQRAGSALARIRDSKNRNEECRILNIMGWIALEQKELLPAKKYLVEALEKARGMKNLDVESKVLANLGMAECFLNGNYALAHEYYEQAYAIVQKLGNRHELGRYLMNLGFVAGMQGDLIAARSYYEQALKIVQEIGDAYAEIHTLTNLSALEGIQNNAGAARQNAQQASELAQKVSDRSGEAWARLYLGHACLMQNEFEPALSAFQASLTIRDELDQPSLSMEPLAGLAAVHLARDDIASASYPAEKILKFLLEDGSALDSVDEPLRIYHICYLYLERKNDRRSLRVLRSAEELLKTQASKIGNELDRRRFVENIPWRRAIRDLAKVVLKDA
jgi:tetratricopeptide (TPR) repeat protein